MENNVNNGEFYSLKDFLMANNACGKFDVYINGNKETGETFFVVGFQLPGQTVKNAQGQDVQAHFNMAFGTQTQKDYALSPVIKTKLQVRDFILQNFSELRGSWPVKKDGSKSVMPSISMRSASGDLGF